LGIIAEGSVIGLEEAILISSKTYTTTVICKSTENDKKKRAILYRIRSENFKKIVTNSSSVSQLRSNSVRNVNRLANQIRATQTETVARYMELELSLEREDGKKKDMK
jgi:hypothetical protein